MNDHLKQILEKIIPKMRASNIKYWVYGGLGYASIVGRFYRNIPDVDLFVLDKEFEKVEEILGDLSKENKWKICKTFIRSGRPKIELYINNKERCSVIPVYTIDEYVEFKFSKGSQRYPLDILEQVERKLENFEFYTPQDNFLKLLLLGYLESKTNYPKKRIEDARHILSKKEFEKYFPNECYAHNF